MKFVKLNTLKDLNRSIHKKWIYKDENKFNLAQNYLQKINYSIQDINYKSENLEINNESINFIVCCVAWIEEAYAFYEKSLKNGIVSNFNFSNETKLTQAKKYFKAIRSFILAHPLGTDRHKDMGLDGNYICIDIMTKDCPSIILLNNREKHFRSFRYDGMENGKKKCNFFLKTYSNYFYNSQYSVYIGIVLEDILGYARLCINKLYELSRYLNKLKKKEFDMMINHE